MLHTRDIPAVEKVVATSDYSVEWRKGGETEGEKEGGRDGRR